MEFGVSELGELRVADEPPRMVLPPEPYHAWLCTPLVFEITAVTPGDPARDPFSSWVLGAVKRERAVGPTDHPRGN
jgi:hypothetical protein